MSALSHQSCEFALHFHDSHVNLQYTFEKWKEFNYVKTIQNAYQRQMAYW